MCCKWKSILGKLTNDYEAIDKEDILDKLSTEEYDVYVLDTLFRLAILDKEEYVNYLQRLIAKMKNEVRYAELLLSVTTTLDLPNDEDYCYLTKKEVEALCNK